MSKRKRPRRRIQREFIEWLAERRDGPPLTVMFRTDRVINLRVRGWTDCVVITLTNELVVKAQLRGEVWDLLCWFDCKPVRTGNHYLCAFCPADSARRYVTREALWREHLFEPLSRWLADANRHRYLHFYSFLRGSTSAELSGSPANPDGASLTVPLHSHRT